MVYAICNATIKDFSIKNLSNTHQNIKKKHFIFRLTKNMKITTLDVIQLKEVHVNNITTCVIVQ
jgi:hypothetical protein